MRCLLVSDLHYTLKQYDWVLNKARDFDVVVIAGDHLDIASPVEIRAQIAVIQTYLKRIGAQTRTITCSGNHDLDARNAEGEKYAKWILKARQFGVPTDDDCMTVENMLFTICPWWDGPLSCAQVEEQLDRDSRKTRDEWVWVYHAPPDASPTSWTGKKHFGDARLVQWIERYSPDMVLAGHIHQSPFREGGSWVDQLNSTWVLNPGRQPGPWPAHIIVDTERQQAVWFSLAGAEIVPLNHRLTRPVSALTELPDWLR